MKDRAVPRPRSDRAREREAAARGGRLLDVPSRESFVANLLRSANAARTAPRAGEVASEPEGQSQQQQQQQQGRTKTFKTEPPAELMSRLRSFLPQMAAANEVLEREAAEDSSKFDIENVGEDEEKVIEMNIGLGVFEVKNDQFDVESDVVIHPAPGNSRPKLPDDAIVELNLARAPGSPRAADPPRATDPPRAADPPRANDPPKAADQ